MDTFTTKREVITSLVLIICVTAAFLIQSYVNSDDEGISINISVLSLLTSIPAGFFSAIIYQNSCANIVRVVAAVLLSLASIAAAIANINLYNVVYQYGSNYTFAIVYDYCNMTASGGQALLGFTIGLLSAAVSKGRKIANVQYNVVNQDQFDEMGFA